MEPAKSPFLRDGLHHQGQVLAGLLLEVVAPAPGELQYLMGLCVGIGHFQFLAFSSNFQEWGRDEARRTCCKMSHSHIDGIEDAMPSKRITFNWAPRK